MLPAPLRTAMGSKSEMTLALFSASVHVILSLGPNLLDPVFVLDSLDNIWDNSDTHIQCTTVCYN
jgi:hypothetical protein